MEPLVIPVRYKCQVKNIDVREMTVNMRYKKTSN